MSGPGLFVNYCAKDILDGTRFLDPWDELAYRRVIDLIYATNDTLIDDDRKLARETKVGSRWPAIKARLVDAGKIEIVDGRISQLRCRAELAKSARKIEQKSLAGRASAESRKSLEDNDTTPTAVGSYVATNQELRTTNHQEGVPSKTESLFGENENRNPSDSIDLQFAVWWACVPKKVAKPAALRAFRAARKVASIETLTAGIKAYAAKVAGKDPQYVAHPATWLNQRRWEDEDIAPPSETVIDISAAARARIRERWSGRARANG